MKKTLTLLLVCLVMLNSWGCGQQSGTTNQTATTGAQAATTTSLETASIHDRTVNVAFTSLVKSFDPINYLSLAEAIGYAQVFDTLVSKNHGEILPNLAKRWEVSEDGLIYTFYLQENVTWSDGQPFTSDDVKFTFEYYIKDCPAMAFQYTDVDRIEILDELTLEVHLSAPRAVFLSELCSNPFASILPKHGKEQYGDSFGTSPETIVGTGAYIVKEFRDSISVTFEARKDYWAGTPAIKNAVLHQITDANAIVVAMQTGEIDIYFNPISGVALETLQKADNVSFMEYLSGRNDSIYMNVTQGSPFEDVRMRQAVAHAINKEDALTIGVAGEGQVVIYPGDIGAASTANPDFVPSKTYEHDLEKSKALVEACGMTGATITIKSYNTDPYASLAVWLQSVLTSIGLDAQVEPMERATFLEQVAKGEVDICPLAWADSTGEFYKMFSIYVASTNTGRMGNYGFYVNQRCDDLLAQANATFDIEARKEIFKELVNIYMEDVPSVALYATNVVIPFNAELACDAPTTYRIYDFVWAK